MKTPAAEIQTLIQVIAGLPPDCSIGTTFVAANLTAETFPFLSISYDPRLGFHLEAFQGGSDTALLTVEQLAYFLTSASEQAPAGAPVGVYAVHPEGSVWPVVAVQSIMDDEFAMFVCIPPETGDPAPLLNAYARKNNG